jgi:parvulin-like peptidyl-prolyl isomerase
MTSTGKFALRLAIYGSILGYVAGDLLVFQGPLHRRLEKNRPDTAEAIAAAKAGGTVARVFSHPILRSQLERAVHERLWLEGRSLAEVPEPQLKQLRYAALGELIDHQLLRMKVKVNTFDLPVTPDEVEARHAEFASRFPSAEDLKAAMVSQGIPDEQALRDRLAARIQQEKYVAMRIGPLAVVSDEEVATWYAENQEHFAQPARIEVRHLFQSTLTRPPEEAQQTLATALASLKDGSGDFAALAKELSEDAASRDAGGALGWMTRERLPPELAAQIFDLPLNEPQLVRSRLGWHLLEVTGRRPPEARSLEEAGPEVRAALEAVKQRDAIAEFRSALRQHEEKRIEIFHDMMEQ